MDDLMTWLLACIDEDERHGRAVIAGAWLWNDYIDEAGAAFMDNHGAEQLLRDVAAKRRIIGVHEHFPAGAGVGCGVCAWDGKFGEIAAEGWCTTLRLLALPYADRPGYREEWAPAE